MFWLQGPQDLQENPDLSKQTSMTVSTIVSDQKMSTSVVSGVTIENEETGTRQELPPLYTLNTIPVTEDDIPTVDDVRRWPYLLESGVTVSDEASLPVGLLIGGNAAVVMEPLRFVKGEDGGPYATLTRFGWILGGLKNVSSRCRVNRIKVNENDPMAEEWFENRAEALGGARRRTGPRRAAMAGCWWRLLLGAMAAAAARAPLPSCPPADVAFELWTGFVYSAPADLLDTRPGTLLLDQCAQLCAETAACRALNYETGLCVLFSSSAEQFPGSVTRSQYPVFTLYLQKICLSGAADACRRPWAFERVPGHQLSGYSRRRVGASSGRHCLQLCLHERTFPCSGCLPVSDGQRVCLSVSDGQRVCLPVSDGQRVCLPVSDGQWVCLPVSDGQRVCLPVSDGQRVCLPVSDGQRVCLPVSDGQRVCLPVSDGQRVCLSVSDGQRVCLPVSDGQRVCLPVSDWVSAAPSASDRRVVAAAAAHLRP
ncbi:Keratin-associated protein 12-2 [Amphibalanus amphitrite]|uniref:Keratin-associated protein 12-2 n=1 Tax=Amphibalanus amphitrite TaxID=1232801 RepID=A0A6A4X0U5_AMPAM|nr:Keratin-associated protein 12-2 [Amphibalanus amphitrite]